MFHTLSTQNINVNLLLVGSTSEVIRMFIAWIHFITKFNNKLNKSAFKIHTKHFNLVH